MTWELWGKASFIFMCLIVMVWIICMVFKYWNYIKYYKSKLHDLIEGPEFYDDCDSRYRHDR